MVARMSVVGALFDLARLSEIGGGCLIWGHVCQGRFLAWVLLGTALLSLYGMVAALQPIGAFGQVYAAYERLSDPGVRFLREPYRYPWGIGALLLDQDGSPVLLQQGENTR